MNRNELTTLLQLSRGVKIVAVRFITSFPLPGEDDDDKDDFDYMSRVAKSGRSKVETYNGVRPDSKPRDRTYHYKTIGLGVLYEGDTVIVQVRDSAAVAQVDRVYDYIPPEMDVDRKLRYVLGKVDMAFGRRLEREEQAILDKLQEAEVKSKLADFEKSSGFSISTIDTPMLTALSPPAVNPGFIDPDTPVVEPEDYYRDLQPDPEMPSAEKA